MRTRNLIKNSELMISHQIIWNDEIRSDQRSDRPGKLTDFRTRNSNKNFDQSRPKRTKTCPSRPQPTEADQGRPKSTTADESRTSSTLEKPRFVRILMNLDHIWIEIRIEFRRVLITHVSRFGSNVELFGPKSGSTFRSKFEQLDQIWSNFGLRGIKNRPGIGPGTLLGHPRAPKECWGTTWSVPGARSRSAPRASRKRPLSTKWANFEGSEFEQIQEPKFGSRFEQAEPQMTRVLDRLLSKFRRFSDH